LRSVCSLSIELCKLSLLHINHRDDFCNKVEEILYREVFICSRYDFSSFTLRKITRTDEGVEKFII
jgi:hypothetical protein